MTKLRVGIVGVGFIATGKHLPALGAHPDLAEVVGFCDIELDKAEAAKEQFGSADAYSTTDYRQLLADPSIEVIHVCTWNVSHAEIACAALQAGKHVLCEKPMAITGADARRMVETAERTGKKLSVGFQNRFRPENQLLARVIGEGRLGQIYAGQAHAVRRRGVPTWGVFTDKEKQGGGPLIDLGGHAVDLALWFMDNYLLASVTGVVNHKLGNRPEGNMMGPWDPATYTVEDSAFGFVRFTDGASLYVESSWALNVADSREACVTLCGTEGGADTVQVPGSDNLKVTLNSVQGGALVKTSPEVGAVVFSPGKPPLSGSDQAAVDEAGSWLTAINTDGEPLVTARQACVVTEILDAIYTSAATGRPVYFTED